MRKKILYISPTSLYPKIMASQDRILNMALYLSKDHDVDVALPYEKDNLIREKTLDLLSGISGDIYFIKYLNKRSFFLKLWGHFIKKIFELIFSDPGEAFFSRQRYVINQLAKIIEKKRYDIVQIEYWYQSELLKKIKKQSSIKKVIDTHNVLFEKRELEKIILGDKYNLMTKQINKYKKLELGAYREADLLISISKPDLKYFKAKFPDKEHILIYTGQNLKPFLSEPLQNIKENTVLFYGSMGGVQNTEAFWRLYKNIFPLIKKEVPDAKLLVVGANPPDEISRLHNGKDITITGYVDNLITTLSKASIMILPMNIAGGFRSRVVEVMALGIPVIGTHNALDATSITHGHEGYIDDDNTKIAQYAIELLKNQSKRKFMGEQARKYCINNFSFERTYGKLSKYYSEM